jgi:hypothetical protein
MRKRFQFIFLVFILAVASANASAFVINFDLQAWPSANPSSVTYSGQGALADPGNDVWNSGGNGWEEDGFTHNDLAASDGTPTDVDFSVTASKNLNWNDVGNDLLSDYQFIDTGSIGPVPTNPATMTLSSLDPGTPYRLYLYAAGDAEGKGSKFTSNGVTKETTGTVSSDFIKGGNYVILDTVSDPAGTVTVTWQLRQGASQAALNGFQLTTPSNDFSGNGKVAMEDFAILSNDWQNGYDMTDLQEMAADWLMIMDVAFKSNPVIETDAVEGIAYSSTLSDDLLFFDASQLSFSKRSGPGWLTVAADGTLSGTPTNLNVGMNSFTVQVETLSGLSDQATLVINVTGDSSLLEVVPAPYGKALRNPLKGFTTRGIYTHEWATLAHTYIKWNELENDESDDINKIITFCNNKWKNVEKTNVKVIPRVYLDWDSSASNQYWPADMTTFDYSSEQFKQRVVRLIQRLGSVWDTDPRVAFVEMGIFGKWGEQEQPAANAELDLLVADAFAAAFQNKLVSVRENWQQFQSQPFGEYWDSWAHYDQMRPHGNSIAMLNTATGRYLQTYVGGEVAYGWGNSDIQPGPSPTASVSEEIHRNFVINSIRWLHCTQLRWIEDYDTSNPQARAGADLMQQAFGYRYILEKVLFNPSITEGTLSVVLHVKNEGSAPFYYDWPLEVSLLDINDHSVVWKQTFADADIRDWLPGDGWTAPEWQNVGGWREYIPNENWVSNGTPGWTTPPQTYTVAGDFAVTLPAGQYILALAVLDPAGNLPSLRFATSQYFTGGRHPVGIVTVNQSGGGPLPWNMVFDDPAADNSLHYSLGTTP